MFLSQLIQDNAMERWSSANISNDFNHRVSSHCSLKCKAVLLSCVVIDGVKIVIPFRKRRIGLRDMNEHAVKGAMDRFNDKYFNSTESK